MNRQHAARLIMLAAAAVACVGVFWLPWYCSSDRQATGESYVFGFNNSVAILSLAVAIALATIARLVSDRPPAALSWFEGQPRLMPSWRESRGEYAVLGLGSLLLAMVLLAWGLSLADPGWGEAKWFLYAIDLLALGRSPYRDFQFNYGPAMLFVPWSLSAASGGALSFERSYLAVVVLFTLLGFAALFLLTRCLVLPRWQRVAAIGLSMAPWAPPTLGLQYTPLRFFVVPAAVVLMDAVVRRGDFAGPPAPATLALAAIAAGSAAGACVALSPEMGIAGCFAILAYAAVLWMAGRRSVSAAVFAGCVASVGISILCLPDYFHSVGVFAGGSENFPIYPSGYNILLVVLAMAILPQVIVAAFLQPQDIRSPLAMSLAIGGGMTLPAALGRCDPGHVFINSTVLMTLVFAAAAARGTRWAIGWGTLYAVAFIILSQFSYWGHYWGNYQVAWELQKFCEKNPGEVASWRQRWERLRSERPQGRVMHWSSPLPYPWELEILAKKGPIMLICGADRNLFITRFLNLQEVVPPDYFHPYGLPAITPDQLDRKVRETLAARFLLIPEAVLAPLEGEIDMPAYERSVHAGLSWVLFYPVRSPARRPPYLAGAELAKRLLEHFVPVGKYHNYVVLQRKEKAPGGPGERSGRTQAGAAIESGPPDATPE